MASDSKKVLVPVADGCEEMEAVITIDVLVRAGAAVTVASVDQQTVKCSRGVKLQADMLIADASKETYDLIAVPVSFRSFFLAEESIMIISRHCSFRDLMLN